MRVLSTAGFPFSHSYSPISQSHSTRTPTPSNPARPSPQPTKAPATTLCHSTSLARAHLKAQRVHISSPVAALSLVPIEHSFVFPTQAALCSSFGNSRCPHRSHARTHARTLSQQPVYRREPSEVCPAGDTCLLASPFSLVATYCTAAFPFLLPPTPTCCRRPRALRPSPQVITPYLITL